MKMTVSRNVGQVKGTSKEWWSIQWEAIMTWPEGAGKGNETARTCWEASPWERDCPPATSTRSRRKQPLPNPSLAETKGGVNTLSSLSSSLQQAPLPLAEPHCSPEGKGVFEKASVKVGFLRPGEQRLDPRRQTIISTYISDSYPVSEQLPASWTGVTNPGLNL